MGLSRRTRIHIAKNIIEAVVGETLVFWAILGGVASLASEHLLHLPHEITNNVIIVCLPIAAIIGGANVLYHIK